MRRKEQATAMRDAALTVVRAKGTMREVSGTRMLMTDSDGLTILLRTPFQRMPDPTPPKTYDEALALRSFEPPLPYEIDVWAERKVLSVSWDEAGEVKVGRLRAGPWQTDLLRQAETGGAGGRSAPADAA